MSTDKLDKIAPNLTEAELAIALNACKKAGAINAADALSKHITRLQIDVELMKKELEQRRFLT